MNEFKKVPKFKTIKEEADFWDSHDITDYLAEMKEVKTSFSPVLPKKESLTIRIQANLKRRLEEIAHGYGINLSTLARIWFIDKLKEFGDSDLSKVS